MTAPRLLVAMASADAIPPVFWSVLSDTERRKAESLSIEKRRNEYIVGHALIRYLLQELTGLPAASHTVLTTDAGKPICEDGPGVSISHSRGMVACAASELGEIGIDIQFADSERETDRLAAEYFSPAEKNWLNTQPREAFYMLWALKEAWLKALGSGLGGGLDGLRCRVEPPSLKVSVNLSGDCILTLYGISSAFLACAMITNRHPEIVTLEWDAAGKRLTRGTQLREIASGECRATRRTT